MLLTSVLAELWDQELLVAHAVVLYHKTVNQSAAVIVGLVMLQVVAWAAQLYLASLVQVLVTVSSVTAVHAALVCLLAPFL